MPVPKTKEELIQQGLENYQKLNQLIDSFPPEKQVADFPEGTMNRNIRDVLAHLHHWHLMLFDWHEIGKTGKQPNMPADGYGWNDTPALNKKIWEDYQGVELAEIREKLQDSFEQTQTIISLYSTEELFEKKRYLWTGSSSMATYLRLNTSSHYMWAIKLIKRMKK